MGLREWMNQWRPTTKMSKADAQEKWDWAWDPETAGALEALLQEESALQFSLPDTHSLPKAWPYAFRLAVSSRSGSKLMLSRAKSRPCACCAPQVW